MLQGKTRFYSRVFLFGCIIAFAIGGSACINQQTGELDLSFLLLPVIVVEEYSKVPGYMAGGTIHDPHAVKVGNGQTVYVSPYQLDSSSVLIVHPGY